MKKSLSLWLVTFALLLFASTAFAAEKTVAGPKGGRLLASTPQQAEFFVNKERRIEITFYDANLKPISPSEQSVEVRVGKNAFQLERQGETLPLPEGHEFLVVVRITPKAGDKPQNFRVPFHDGICSGCKRAEYACICDHHGDEGGGHQH